MFEEKLSAETPLLRRRWWCRGMASLYLSNHKTSSSHVPSSFWVCGKMKKQPLLCVTSKASVTLALPSVLLAKQWINLWGPCSAWRIAMVTVPFVLTSVLSRILSESSNCTPLGGLDSTIHKQINPFTTGVQWEVFHISGESVKTGKKTFPFSVLSQITYGHTYR